MSIGLGLCNVHLVLSTEAPDRLHDFGKNGKAQQRLFYYTKS